MGHKIYVCHQNKGCTKEYKNSGLKFNFRDSKVILIQYGG